MNEELNIKLKVDTSELDPVLTKVKNSVSNVNKSLNSSALSGLSKSTASATADSKKLSQSMDKIQRTVQGITSGMSGWDFAKAITGISLIQKAIDKVFLSLDGKQGHFSNAFASLIPSSELYKNVPWEGWDVAWENFNANILNGFNEWGTMAGNAILKIRDGINSIPSPTQLWVGFKNLARSAKEVVSTKLWNFMFQTRLHIGVAQEAIKKFVKDGLDKIKNFKMPSLSDMGKSLTNSFSKLGKSIKNIGPNIKSLISGDLTKVANGFNSIKLTSTASAGAIAGAGAALAAFAAAAAVFVAVGVTAALSVSKLGNEVYNSANKFGFSTKAYQEWSYVMERSGSSIEDLKGYLETLGSEQAAVITGSEEAAQKFKNLGISAEEAASMDSQTLFETTITKLQGIEDATTRSAYAYELFGDEASRLMNVINMSNGEMQEAINQYNLLGGAMSGELVEKSNRLQNSIANMKQAWQGISNTLAEVFIPVVQKVVNWLTKAFVWVNLFLRTIFGLDLKSSSKSTDKAASSTNKYTGGLKAATKAAEELKRTTMGFDELNIVQDPNKGGSADTGASSAGLGGNIPSLDSALLNMEDLNLDSMYAWFEQYKGLIAQIATWSLILIGVILAVIGICTMNIPMALLGIGMAGLGIAIGFKSGAFEEAWGGLQNIIRTVCEAIGLDADTVTKAIAKFFEVAWIVIKGVWDLVGPYFEIVWAKISGIFSVVVTYLGGMFSTAWAVIEAVWNVGVTFFDTVGALIKAIFAIVGSVITGDFKGAWDAIVNVWNKAKAFFKAIVDGIFSVFSSVVNWFGNTFAAAWNAVTKVFSKVGNFFKGVWNIIKDIFKSIGGSIGEAVSGAFSSAINWVLDKAIGIINGFISAINAAIGVINAIPGVEIKKLSKLQVPKLAEGGIATRSMIANIGEAGKEAVLPLENNTEWMDTLADKIAARNSGPTKIVLQVGEKELGWATIDSINSITKQTGTIQLTL